jgi:hypothetical protein
MSVPAAKPRGEQAAAQPAPDQQPSAAEQFSFEDAFTADALNGMAVRALPESEATDGASAPEAATLNPSGGEPSETGQAGDQPPAATEGDAASDGAASEQPTAAPEQPGRRARGRQADAERIQSYEDKLAAARQEWEAERNRADEANRALEQRRLQDEANLKQISHDIGPQEEFERLNGLPSTELTGEEQDKLDAWKLERSKLGPRIEAARRMVANGLRQEAALVQQLPGISGETIANTAGENAFSQLCTYFYNTGKGQAEEAARERIAELEAELEDLRTRSPVSTNRPLVRGGASSVGAPQPNNGPVFDPTHSAEWNLQQAFPVPQRRG